VHAVRAQMLALKQSAMAPLSLAVLGALGVAPPAVQSQALSVLSTKASAVTTNVPGPASHRHLAGAQIRRMLFWVPQAGHIGLGVSILSYAQEVQFGLMADQQLLPQPQALLDQVQREWSLLVHAVLLAGQGDAHQPQRLAAQMAWWCEQG